jgi:hypothetical protein
MMKSRRATNAAGDREQFEMYLRGGVGEHVGVELARPSAVPGVSTLLSLRE